MFKPMPTLCCRMARFLTELAHNFVASSSKSSPTSTSSLVSRSTSTSSIIKFARVRRWKIPFCPACCTRFNVACESSMLPSLLQSSARKSSHHLSSMGMFWKLQHKQPGHSLNSDLPRYTTPVLHLKSCNQQKLEDQNKSSSCSDIHSS